MVVAVHLTVRASPANCVSIAIGLQESDDKVEVAETLVRRVGHDEFVVDCGAAGEDVGVEVMPPDREELSVVAVVPIAAVGAYSVAHLVVAVVGEGIVRPARGFVDAAGEAVVERKLRVVVVRRHATIWTIVYIVRRIFRCRIIFFTI